jgi:hypothetical protein
VLVLAADITWERRMAEELRAENTSSVGFDASLPVGVGVLYGSRREWRASYGFPLMPKREIEEKNGRVT